MHQILSYQTAMRAGNDRDGREYITRRICVSFVFSVGFFTLIAGFLLGKFVSDRQHLINRMKLERDPNPMRNLELTLNTLVPIAANLTRQQHALFHPNTNTKLWDSWKTCFGSPELTNYDQKPVDYTAGLVDTYLRMFNKCLNELAYVLTHDEGN